MPRIDKIVVNAGLGDVKDNAKSFNMAVDELGLITGQKPLVTTAKKAVANFKLREGMKIGAKITLRGEKMWEFLDRLISVALPRVRDFRGISPKSFDGKGNYSMGIKEQLVFPEIDYDKIEKVGVTKQNKLALKISKTINTHQYNLIVYISDKSKSIEIQTMYIIKKKKISSLCV